MEKEKELSAVEKLIINVIKGIISNEPQNIKESVDKVRKKHPEWSREKLAKKLTNDKALINGTFGGVTSVGSFVTLPLGVTADLVASWKLQAILSYAIAYIYGIELDEEVMTLHTLALMAGNSGTELLKKELVALAKKGIEKVGEKTGEKVVEKIAVKSVCKIGEKMLRPVLVETTPKLLQKVAMNTTAKTASKIAKAIPLIGIPIGFGVDFGFTKAFGSAAIAYYSWIESECVEARLG